MTQLENKHYMAALGLFVLSLIVGGMFGAMAFPKTIVETKEVIKEVPGKTEFVTKEVSVFVPDTKSLAELAQVKDDLRVVDQRYEQRTGRQANEATLRKELEQIVSDQDVFSDKYKYYLVQNGYRVDQIMILRFQEQDVNFTRVTRRIQGVNQDVEVSTSTMVLKVQYQDDLGNTQVKYWNVTFSRDFNSEGVETYSVSAVLRT